jgi:plastocyanin
MGTAHDHVMSRCIVTILCWVVSVSAHAATFNVRVVDRNSRPVSGLVVTLEAVAVDRKPTSPGAVMDQVEQRFVPFVLPVRTGTAVRFPNSDSVAHQVYSFSAPKRFELGLYRGRPHPPVVFDKPGVVVVGCNIHDKMIGYVFVTDAAYFGQTDASGTWRVDAAVPTEYRLTVWSPLLANDEPSLQRTVSLRDAQTNELVIQLKRPVQAEPGPQPDRKLRDY